MTCFSGKLGKKVRKPPVHSLDFSSQKEKETLGKYIYQK
jgi:hypothetical protein